jgi:hypothetical protein
VQADPIKPVLKAPRSILLKLGYDEPLSNCGFNFNLRRYTLVKEVLDDALRGIVTSSYEFPLFSKTGLRVELLLNANPRQGGAG